VGHVCCHNGLAALSCTQQAHHPNAQPRCWLRAARRTRTKKPRCGGAKSFREPTPQTKRQNRRLHPGTPVVQTGGRVRLCRLTRSQLSQRQARIATAWQPKTNVWRTKTNPEPETKRPTSVCTPVILHPPRSADRGRVGRYCDADAVPLQATRMKGHVPICNPRT
jgi:hypothetical protein